MADEHPLERQNAIERAIQLEGPKDPDNFKMPDGRTLTAVRQANEEKHQDEFLDEAKMLGARTRELSIPEFSKGKNLVMTSVGNLVDVTPPPAVEKVEHVSIAELRTAAADVAPPGDFDAPRSGESMPSAAGQSGTSSSMTGTSSPPSSAPSGKAAGEVTSSDISS
jgi:hypothetical protein